MTSTTLRASAIDAVARSDKPGKNFGAIQRLQVSAGTPQMIGHVQVSTPRVVGVVQSAVLRFTQAGLADAGNRTLSLRRITQTWREQRLTWKNRPSRVGTATDTAAVNGAVDGRGVGGRSDSGGPVLPGQSLLAPRLGDAAQRQGAVAGVGEPGLGEAEHRGLHDADDARCGDLDVPDHLRRAGGDLQALDRAEVLAGLVAARDGVDRGGPQRRRRHPV